MKKKCSTCGEIKELEQYYRCRTSKDGHAYECKQCASIRSTNKERDPTYRYRRWALNTIKTHSKREGHSINFTVEELQKIAENTIYCGYCGRKLNWERGTKGKSPRSDNPTLDRINNDKDLTLENTAIVCMRCNTTKGYHTMEEFIDYCTQVVLHNG